MTIHVCYRRALWLPILLPLLVIPDLFRHEFTTESVLIPLTDKSITAAISLFLIGSLFWGGLPYLLTLFWYRSVWCKGDLLATRRLIRTLPVRMIPFLIPCVSIQVPFSFRISLTDLLSHGWLSPMTGSRPYPYLGLWVCAFVYTTIATLLLGYLYVAITELVIFALKSPGHIKES